MDSFASQDSAWWNQDTDGDNLSNFEEYQSGTDPLSADTDGDGLSDDEELGGATITNPKNVDTDNDGIYDKLDSEPLLKMLPPYLVQFIRKVTLRRPVS